MKTTKAAILAIILNSAFTIAHATDVLYSRLKPGMYDATTKQDGVNSEQHPIPIQTVPAQESEEQTKKEVSEEKEKLFYDRILTIATVLLAIFTGGLWLATYRLAKEARSNSERQADEMKESIAEASRSASAMEKVASVTALNSGLMKFFWQKQMRAYLSVDHGIGTYQDANVNFAGQAILNNVGLTPARNVSYSVNAGILDFDPSADTAMPPIGAMNVSDVGIAPRQQLTINTHVTTRIPESEVDEVMLGNGRCLFLWGKIIYEDIFGNKWHTNFCHRYIFLKLPDGSRRPTNFYYPKHNDAT